MKMSKKDQNLLLFLVGALVIVVGIGLIGIV